LGDRLISVKSIAVQLGISRERVGSIIHEDVDMRKLSAQWVPKCLNAVENINGAIRLSKFGIISLGAIQMISCRARLVIIDETWLYHYEPETKQQSMEWRHSRPPRPKKFRVQKSTGKFLTATFWDRDGIFLIDYLPKSQTISAEYD
jgi:histone-lysine N-methyltransferase SETMAR